ncbi:hypothetical protein F4808DRAFT_354183 [Astrocystis sublimbata]|nr:hypothetical protein F4808DRAFT_354183 [Astrocystis sublimbata]
MFFANTGVTEKPHYFGTSFDNDGRLLELARELVDVNYNVTLFTVKLAWHIMRLPFQQDGTSWPDPRNAINHYLRRCHYQWRATRRILTGLLRPHRRTYQTDGTAYQLIAFTDLALVYAATATQGWRVEVHGK